VTAPTKSRPAQQTDAKEDPNDQTYSGGYVGLIPADEHQGDLAVDSGLDPEDLHLTLGYLGDDVTGWPDENKQALLDRMTEIASDTADGPVMARVFGHALLNPDGGPDGEMDPCLVYLVGESPQLEFLHSMVRDTLSGRDGVPSQRPNFLPHVTAGYGLSPGDASYTGPVTFDRMRVALAGDTHDIPLGRGRSTRPPKPVRGAAGENPQFVDVRVVSSNPDDLAAFVQLCKLIGQLCGVGASRDVRVAVDGDGSGALKFDFGDSDVSDVMVPNIDEDLVIGIGG
jgi:2'-5' RNA ligase